MHCSIKQPAESLSVSGVGSRTYLVFGQDLLRNVGPEGRKILIESRKLAAMLLVMCKQLSE